MTAPLCAMWEGHCGNPARLVVDTTKRIAGHDVPLSWLCCDDLGCIYAAQNHATHHGLTHVDTRPLTVADIAAYAVQMEAVS